jgi:hypothetical protein
MKIKKEILEKTLKSNLANRRVLKREIEVARKQLENLECEQEDNECEITDIRDCLKNGIYS